MFVHTYVLELPSILTSVNHETIGKYILNFCSLFFLVNLDLSIKTKDKLCRLQFYTFLCKIYEMNVNRETPIKV